MTAHQSEDFAQRIEMALRTGNRTRRDDVVALLAAYERLRDALRAIDALPIDGAFMSDTLAIVEAALTGSPVEGTR